MSVFVLKHLPLRCFSIRHGQSRITYHYPSEASSKPDFLTWKHYDKILEIGIFVDLYFNKQYRKTINIHGKSLLSNDNELNEKIFTIRADTTIRVFVGADDNILSVILSQNDIPMNILVIPPTRRLINLRKIYLNTDIDLMYNCITSGIRHLKKSVILLAIKRLGCR